MDATTNAPSETVTERITRLALTEIGEKRLESLAIAHDLGVSDETFARLGNANRVARGTTVILPSHRFERLSRGKGWCRMGRGDKVTWGEREDGGYRVGPGRWTVGGNDGFTRKGQDEWTVAHISVAGQTWTIAD